MIFCRLTKKIAFLTLLLINASFASDKLEGMGNFKVLPKPLQKYILLDLLSPEDIDVLRVGSKGMKKFIDDDYEEKLRKELGNNEKSVLKDLLSDNPKITIAHFKHHYTQKIMQKICEEYLKKDGFLCVSQGSYLEGYLSQNYKLVPFYDYLENQPTVMTQLFNILFKKNIPEGKEGLALNFLTGCLPINHIYVEKDGKEIDFYTEKFTEILLKSINRDNKIKYFLLGLDTDYTVLKDGEHVIVINQSNQGDLVSLKDFPHETIILNADQEEFTSQPLPKNMKNLILVNGNHKCFEVGYNFLIWSENLRLCTTKGLKNVRKIKRSFLNYCKRLLTFDNIGLYNVEKIDSFFLNNCASLQMFDTTPFTKLKIINNDFLSKCLNLVTFIGTGLRNIEEINANFLCDCEKLSNFVCKDLNKVKEIGDYFLNGCINLLSFDKISLNNLKIIKEGFLSNCKNLQKFSYTSFQNVKEIGKIFLAYNDHLDGEKIKEEILRKKK